MSKYKKLEDYGLIGNLDSCALVGKDGSIDWCCFPHIESASVFAALLDADKGGRFRITPAGPFQSIQSYIDKTNVLKTTFAAVEGKADLVDFMPLKGWDPGDEFSHQAICRKLICTAGRMDFLVDFEPRFDYARAETKLKATGSGVLATAGRERIIVKGSQPLRVAGGKASGRISLAAGEKAWLVLQYGHERVLSAPTPDELLTKTIDYWRGWVHSCREDMCVFGGPWHDLIIRSGLVLKLLTHQNSGAIAAAPTTSLPETIGGERNWDYRYNWIRDSAFTVQALYNVGHIEEARKHLTWFMNICRDIGDPAQTKILYGMHGEEDLREIILPHLSGYRDSRPVRVGNGAARQVQLDVYGELVDAIYNTTKLGVEVDEDFWLLVRKIVDYVIKVWPTKDSGIWEVRSRPQNFVYSKLMCWVALDRGVKMAELQGHSEVLADWRRVRDEIKAAILEKGFSSKLNSFVQSFETESLDASTLLIPLMGLLPFDDPRVKSTIDTVMRELMPKEGLLYRYQSEDGLPGLEGAFILCTFWLVDVLALSGRVAEAEKIFTGILKYISPLGLFAEEIDAATGDMLGNFPQAFSHVGLINSALYLGRALGKKTKGPTLLK